MELNSIFYKSSSGDKNFAGIYRDSKKHEIDLVIRNGRTLHPVEIEAGIQVRKDAIRNFPCLEGIAGCEVGFGHAVCQTPEPYLLSENVQAVPVWAL